MPEEDTCRLELSRVVKARDDELELSRAVKVRDDELELRNGMLME